MGFVIICILQVEGLELSVTQILTMLLPSIDNLMFFGDEFFFNLVFLFETGHHLLAHIGIG